MSERTIPILMIIGMALSALVYASSGDARRAIYWAAAAVLNAAVTW